MKTENKSAHRSARRSVSKEISKAAVKHLHEFEDVFASRLEVKEPLTKEAVRAKIIGAIENNHGEVFVVRNAYERHFFTKVSLMDIYNIIDTMSKEIADKLNADTENHGKTLAN